MGDIRKLSIGLDYKTAMHYIVGQDVLNSTQKIHQIIRDDETDSYKIYIEDEEGAVVMWKEFNRNVPISIEYNINF